MQRTYDWQRHSEILQQGRSRFDSSRHLLLALVGPMSGRPKVKVSPETVQHFRNRGMSWREIAKVLGIGYGTARRIYLGRAKSEPKPSGESVGYQILEFLRYRGDVGATNGELNTFCFRYGARIFELRKRGFKIETRRESAGHFRFVLIARPADFSTLSTNFPKDIGTQ